jgi:hypothetical protein
MSFRDIGVISCKAVEEKPKGEVIKQQDDNNVPMNLGQEDEQLYCADIKRG